MRDSIEVHLTYLHSWMGVILSSAEGVLSELLEANITVSISCLVEFKWHPPFG
jgi:midasin